MKRYTQEEFIEKAKNIHGEKYSYSKVKYEAWDKKVCIICPIHGEFWQTPNRHLMGNGCPQCFNEKRGKSQKLTTEEFIKKAKGIHGEFYNYSKVEYINNHTKVCIICPKHGEFWQIPANHLSGAKCPSCSGKKKGSTEDFIRRADLIHDGKYDYSKVEYTKNNEKVCIICPEHGEFWQTPNKHLRGDGCPICRVNKKLTLQNFIDRSNFCHNYRYDYSKSVYVNGRTKICIICPEHGEFWQNPINHMNGCGCPQCYSIKSKLEKKIEKWLEEINIKYEWQKKFEWLKFKQSMFLDFYLPDYNIAIEIQGEQHFKPIKYFGGNKEYKERQKRDAIKYNLCEKHGIKILYFADEKYTDNIFVDKNNFINEIRKYEKL